MLGAIRISGRWVDLQVLERLSLRSQGPSPPLRSQLISDFCRAIHWRDARGRLALASAGAALRKLERQGIVQLPPRLAASKPRARRSLIDDEQPLPPLPRWPAGSGPMKGLRLRLIQGDKDPAHWIWNRLIIREHPLGDRPLVGAQLRYLIECDAGVVGAFGIGPPAFHLECRDQWIGWSPSVRQQHLGEVIGVSRFLIRPGLRVPNLASHCYGLLFGQVVKDWHGRYGIEPVLVETYVDRTRHEGRSLAAANWQRLGQSKGRGREDRHRKKTKTLKDVWVYELTPKARNQLQALKAEPLPPRSVFAPALTTDWAQEEMAGVDLGDERLNDRATRMLSQRWARPSQSFYRSFDNNAETKGAYKVIASGRAEVSLPNLLKPHQLQTARRMAAEKAVLLAQDTTALSYNTLEETTGLGPIGESGSRGLLLHSLLAFRLDGIPLGTAWAEIWARPPESDTARRNEQSCDEKESGRWIRAMQAANEAARRMPQTMVLVCGDRESDIYELYDQKKAAAPNVHLLVRGQHDRCLSGGGRLLERLAALPMGGRMEVKVPRRGKQPARIAVLELRWQEVEFQPPAIALKKSWPALKIYAVSAKEVDPPEGVKGIEWVILTTMPMTTLKMARRAVRYYALRWGIECWHYVLKQVCKVEDRQMKSARALERALALDMIIASRVLLLARLGKEHPNLAAELFYGAEELEVLAAKKAESGKFPEVVKLTVFQANILTAMLAGFWGRASDGHPGAKILAEGLRLLDAMVWYKRQCAEKKESKRVGGRKPT